MNLLRDQNASQLAICDQFYKVFIMLNKNELEPLQHFLQEKEKAELQTYVSKAFQYSFTSFQSFLCSRR
jgi:hypothetical protein